MNRRTGQASGTGLVVALDHPELEQAAWLAKRLSSEELAFKVGLTLFAAHGPEAVKRISEYGRVFCDLKLHDIPHQVAGAAAKLGQLDIWMLSVHASGGASMMRAAADALRATPQSPVLAAVTVLTSLSSRDLASLGQGAVTDEQALRLAKLATEAGAGAVICSPHELGLLRDELDNDVVLVCPGVRPTGAAQADQARIMSPGEAARAGADHIVVGRPITESKDPVRAATGVLQELYDART